MSRFPAREKLLEPAVELAAQLLLLQRPEVWVVVHGCAVAHSELDRPCARGIPIGDHRVEGAPARNRRGVVADVGAVQDNVALLLGRDRCQQLDTLLMRRLHPAKTTSGMLVTLLVIDHPVVHVAQDHQVGNVARELLREPGVTTRPAGRVRDDVGHIRGVHTRRRDIVAEQHLRAALVLAAASGLPPELKLHGILHRRVRHGPSS